MANWCSTRITFFSENKEQIEKLHNVLRELSAGESRVENGFGNMWLGNIVDYFGENWESFSCRGVITDFFGICTRESISWFEIYQEDAWAPNLDPWNFVLGKEEFSEISFVYLAEEPGCEIYINTDESGMFYGERFVVDAYFEGKDLDIASPSFTYFGNKEDCMSFLKELAEKFGNTQGFETIDEANQWFDKILDDGSFCLIHEFELE